MHPIFSVLQRQAVSTALAAMLLFFAAAPARLAAQATPAPAAAPASVPGVQPLLLSVAEGNYEKRRVTKVVEGTTPGTTASAEEKVPELFRLPPGDFASRQYVLDSLDEDREKSLVVFPSPLVTDHLPNNTVHCEYFLPKTKPARKLPGVIVLHILGGDFDLARAFAVNLADHEVAALFLIMPYYGPRRSAGFPRRMISEDPRTTAAGMRQAILDVRRAATWLANREEIDPAQLGVMGISLGGITSALASSVDPRFTKGVFLLAGGDAGKFPWGSPKLAKMRTFWEKEGYSMDKLVETLRPIDPATYAHNLRGRDVLFMNALHDEIIPRECTEALWEKAGRPPIEWMDAGHISAMRYIMTAFRRSGRHFADADWRSRHPLPAAKPSVEANLGVEAKPASE